MSNARILADLMGTSTTVPSSKLSLAAGDLPAGSVLQMKKAVKKDTQTFTSTTYADITGLSVTLTPRDANSKFIISFAVWDAGTHFKTYLNLLRGSTVLHADADGAGDSRNRSTSAFVTDDAEMDTHGNMHCHSMTVVDEPATSSSVTYKVQSKARSGHTAYVNRSTTDRASTEYDDRFVSHILVMEIAG